MDQWDRGRDARSWWEKNGRSGIGRDGRRANGPRSLPQVWNSAGVPPRNRDPKFCLMMTLMTTKKLFPKLYFDKEGDVRELGRQTLQDL
jgi:hypothetical protein